MRIEEVEKKRQKFNWGVAQLTLIEKRKNHN